MNNEVKNLDGKNLFCTACLCKLEVMIRNFLNEDRKTTHICSMIDDKNRTCLDKFCDFLFFNIQPERLSEKTSEKSEDAIV